MKEIKLEFSVGDSVYTILDNKLSKQKISSVSFVMDMYKNQLIVYKANNDMVTLTNVYKSVDDVLSDIIDQSKKIDEWEDKYGE